MQKIMRPQNKREPRTSAHSAPPPNVVQLEKTLPPTAGNPASWTPEFCFRQSEAARDDESNLVSARVWDLRGHTLRHSLECKRANPYKEMPVDSSGAEVVEVSTPTKKIRLESLGIHT